MIAPSSRYLAVLTFFLAVSAAQSQEGRLPAPTPAKKLLDFEQQRLPVHDDAFAHEPSETHEVAQAFNPHMVGDFQGTFLLKLIKAYQIDRQRPGLALVQVPFASRGPIKIGENESPRPVDRIFAFYRHYNDLQGVGDPAYPSVPDPRYNLGEKVIGFEKTFLGGDASFGMRVPFYSLDGVNDDDSGVGDIGMIVKYAFINDRASGNVLSTGLMLTLPTGELPGTLYGDVHSTLIQPFIGYIVNWNRLYLQGFSSVVIPTDDRDVTLLFNDVGLGYQVYRSSPDRFISGVAPTIEAHLTNPLGSRSADDLIVASDLLVITAGIHVQMYGRATLTFAGATPVSGPDVYDFESMVQFNLRF